MSIAFGFDAIGERIERGQRVVERVSVLVSARRDRRERLRGADVRTAKLDVVRDERAHALRIGRDLAESAHALADHLGRKRVELGTDDRAAREEPIERLRLARAEHVVERRPALLDEHGRRRLRVARLVEQHTDLARRHGLSGVVRHRLVPRQSFGFVPQIVTLGASRPSRATVYPSRIDMPIF